MATISGYNLKNGDLIVLDGFDATGVTVPTAHTTLTARNTADSHPISAITNLTSSLADKISKTDTEEQSIVSNIVIDGDLTVASDTIFSTASPISQTTLSYAEADDKALLTKEQVAEKVATILPTYPSENGTYILKYVLADGVGTLQWVLEA